MKKFILIIFSGLFIFPVLAQKNKRDIVYLKTGGIIQGQVVHNDAEKVKINSAGNEWVFKIAEVDSVSIHEKKTKSTDTYQNYFFDSSAGVLIGNSGNGQTAPFSFMSSVNFKVFNHLYAGAGLGAEFLDETYLPTFAQIQYKFRESRFTPFANLQVGYQIPIEKTSKQQNYYDYYSPDSRYYYPNYQTGGNLTAQGGFMITPSVGFQHFNSDHFGWFFSFGYRYHQLNYSGKDEYKLESNFSRLSLKVGFIFN